MGDWIKELNNLIKFDQMEIKTAYDNYYKYDKVILVDDLVDLMEDLNKEDQKIIEELKAEITYWKETAKYYQNKLKEIQKILNKTLDN